MADPVVHLTNGIPDSGTGNVTTLGQTLLDGANATHGVTTGAAVITDAAGTLQQYLRGLVKLIAAGTSVTISNANVNGQAAMAASAPVVIANNQSTLPVALTPATSGGLSRTRTLIPNNTTNVIIKASAGQVYKIRATNNSANIAYIKLYDAATATAGSGTPVDTIMIPAATAGGAGIVDTTDIGVAHATGITFIVTTGIADADTTAPAASAYIVTIYYK